MAGASNPTATAAPVAPVAAPMQPFNYPQTQPGAGQNVYGQASSLFNQAAAGPNIGQFMNPYSQMVTGNTLNSLERQRQMQMNSIGQQAGAAGAFGGSRHGVAEALTNEGFARTGAETFGNLQSQGFNTALQAAQNQQGIQSGLAGQGFGFGQAIGQQQMQQGTQQQAINQSLIDAIRAQYGGFTGAPNAALQLPLAAVGAANMGQQTTTQQSNPGALGILGGLLSIL
jgi:hypothetical protein